jgi:hypothetical protein
MLIAIFLSDTANLNPLLWFGFDWLRCFVCQSDDHFPGQTQVDGGDVAFEKPRRSLRFG